MKKSVILSVVVILLAFGLWHCSTTTESSGATTSTAVTNLQAVSDDFMPDSLNYTQNSASLSEPPTKDAEESNPCAVVGNDLFACQPVLLQLYMDLAKDMLDAVIDIISGVGTAMGTVEDGATGTATWDDATVQYSKTSATDYSIIILNGATPAGYVDVNDSVYTLKLNLDSIGDSGDYGQFETVVSYTDENTWSINLFLAGMPCSEDDVAAPERIKILINKVSGVWTGKAMLYNPLWRGDLTCSSTATDSTSMDFYTDFVGNDVAAKAKVFMMSRAKDDLSDIADWGMDSLQDNFEGMDNDTSEYVNPFCNPAGTLLASWGDDCSETDATVGAASYSSADDWVTPYDLYQLTVEIPSSLE